MSYTKDQAAAIQRRADSMTNAEAARELWMHAGKPEVLKILTTADVVQLAELRKRIEAGDIEAARGYAATFETAVREEIPAAVYLFIGGQLVVQ